MSHHMAHVSKGRNGVGRGPTRTSLVAKLVEWPAVPDVLDAAERQRLMTETAERLSRQYTGWPINWPEVDAINAKIGETFDRASLAPLLAEYAAAILTGGPAA